MPQLGGCACGAVRFELTALPWVAYLCHCSVCRRQSGAAYGISMFAPRDAFRITQGEPAHWRKRNSAGGESAIGFCSHCASRLYTQREPATHVTLRLGTFDDAGWVRPVGQMWTSSALPWALLEGVLSYEGNPGGYGPMVEAWSALEFRAVEAR